MLKRPFKSRVFKREVYGLGWHHVESRQLGFFQRHIWAEFVCVHILYNMDGGSWIFWKTLNGLQLCVVVLLSVL